MIGRVIGVAAVLGVTAAPAAAQTQAQQDRIDQVSRFVVTAPVDGEIAAFRALLEGIELLRNDGNAISVTAAGFARMDELMRGAVATDQAFIAMWFGEEMSAIYDEAIAPAVLETGLAA